MQRLANAVRSWQETLRVASERYALETHPTRIKKVLSRNGYVASSSTFREKGLENTTVAEVLMTKGAENVGSWLWCLTDDCVHHAVKHMAKNNVGSLMVLNPDEDQSIAGIITERDYLVKVLAQDRQPKYTRVEEVMTDKTSPENPVVGGFPAFYVNKLITVTSDTNVVRAMQLMMENHIRHVPVVDGKMVGMISIVDVVRAVVEQQSTEVKRLNEFIKGDYY